MTDTAPPKLRIMVLDDHPLLRSGVAEIINGTPDLELVAAAASTAEAVAELPEARPDLILLDLHFREGTGLKVVPEIRRLTPAARILVYTGHISEREVRLAGDASVDGYLLKTSDARELLDVIRQVVAGGRYWASEVTSLVREESQLPTPSPCELEVLRRLSAGRTNRQIASDLNLTVNTVIEYILSLRAKLGARNRTEAVQRATQRGLL